MLAESLHAHMTEEQRHEWAAIVAYLCRVNRNRRRSQ